MTVMPFSMFNMAAFALKPEQTAACKGHTLDNAQLLQVIMLSKLEQHVPDCRLLL